MSHFEMYLNTMNQIQSNSSKIKSFYQIRIIKLTAENIEKTELPKFISDFLKFTFEVVSLEGAYKRSCFYIWKRGFDT